MENRIEELQSTIEAAEQLEQKVEKIRSDEFQTEQKVTEDDFKVFLNGTYTEPQVTTEYDEPSGPKLR